MKVLLVDDHPLFCVGLSHALTQAGGVTVLTAPGVDEGLAVAAAHDDIDIVMIDYRLADGDGIEGLRRFGARFPLIARVLTSGDEEPALAARARLAGASGFIGKSLSIDEVLAALNTIARGGVVFEPQPHDSRIAPSAWPTARQLEVLSLIAQGRPNKLIADELGIAERTVKLHVTALLNTLGARNRTHLLVVARDKGLL